MRPHGVWWLAPTGALVLTSIPSLYLADVASPTEYRQQWGTDKYLTSQTVGLAAVGIAVFALASALPSLRARPTLHSAWPNLTPEWRRVIDRAVAPLFWLTIAGYAAFVLSAVRNGVSFGTLLEALRHQDVVGISSELGQIKGVTSLTQVGIAFVVIAALSLINDRRPIVVGQLVLVIALGLIRADLLAERLAIIEMVVPLVSVFAFRFASAGTDRARAIVRAIPVVVVPLVFVAFGAFEYSRSWIFYRQRTTMSFPLYVAERIGGYYATAYNNGQIQLTFGTKVGSIPYTTVQALWTAPGSSLYGGYPGGVDPTAQYAQLLALHGNPEFNSPGGLVLPFVDWGTIGGLVFLAVFGVLIGLAYRYCVDGNSWGILLFPALTTGMFELPRYVYWTLGRFVPSVVALLIVYGIGRRAERRATDQGRSTSTVEAPS